MSSTGEETDAMTIISRRDFVKTAFAGMPLVAALATKIDSVVSGVRLGTITYSFRQLPRTPGASDAVDVMINALTECGIGEIELFSPDLEPRSEEHTSELQSLTNLVCRLLLEKKKKIT